MIHICQHCGLVWDDRMGDACPNCEIAPITAQEIEQLFGKEEPKDHNWDDHFNRIIARTSEK